MLSMSVGIASPRRYKRMPAAWVSWRAIINYTKDVLTSKVRRCTRDAYTCYSDNDDSDACHSLVQFERIKHTKRCMCKVSKIVITENYPHRDSTGNVPMCIVGFFTERPNCIILVPITSSVVLLSLSLY